MTRPISEQWGEKPGEWDPQGGGQLTSFKTSRVISMCSRVENHNFRPFRPHCCWAEEGWGVRGGECPWSSWEPVVDLLGPQPREWVLCLPRVSGPGLELGLPCQQLLDRGTMLSPQQGKRVHPLAWGYAKGQNSGKNPGLPDPEDLATQVSLVLTLAIRPWDSASHFPLSGEIISYMIWSLRIVSIWNIFCSVSWNLTSGARSRAPPPPLGQCTPPAGSLLSISPWRAPRVEALYLKCTGINALMLDAGQDKEKNGRNLLFIHLPVDI